MNLKVSYSCVNNIEKIINSYNNNLIKEFHMNQIQENTFTGNCRVKTECPVGGLCLTENAVYEATIFPKENMNQRKFYIGKSTGDWKQHFYNHRHSFKNISLKNQTVLPKCYWDMKENSFTLQLK